MTPLQQITAHLASFPEPKRKEMQSLHKLIRGTLPKAKLWFDNGKDENNKTVTNPTIGYGQYTIQYANGKSKEFFQVGLSANTAGISVYIMGVPDKTWLIKTWGKKLGKAKVTGYCIRFKSIADLELPALVSAVKEGVGLSSK